MQKKHISFIILYYFLAAVVLVACKKNGSGAGGPISIQSFTPSTGGATTEILIDGKNFIADTSQISVSINGKKLKLIAVNDHQVMALVPKKTGSGPIVLTEGNQTVTSVDTFHYQYTRVVSTLAGNGQPGYVNGNGANAQFHFFDAGNNWYRSEGIVVDRSLNVYVTEPMDHCIRKIDSAGNVTLFAGDPNNGGNMDGNGANAQFQWPWSLCIDANDNVYCIDILNWNIRKITPDGTVTTLASTKAEPWGMTVNKTTGDIYYVHIWSGNVFKLSADGSFHDKIIDNCGLWVAGITCDKSGNLYACSDGDQVVREFAAGTWTPSVIAGTLGVAGVENGVGTAAKFTYPWGLSIDDWGNLYVGGNDGNGASSPDQSIRMITAGTWEVSTFAGSTNLGFTDGIGGAATFAGPINSAVDKNGTVYVLDKRNNAVRKIISE